jgi:hypothetical protein
MLQKTLRSECLLPPLQVTHYLRAEQPPLATVSISDAAGAGILAGNERRPPDARLPPPLGVLKVGARQERGDIWTESNTLLLLGVNCTTDGCLYKVLKRDEEYTRRGKREWSERRKKFDCPREA